LERFDAEGETFLSRIVTGDETWAHHYEAETKRQSVEWHHPQSPRKKKFKTTTSAGKVMIIEFWDTDGVILMEDDESVIRAVRTSLREQQTSWHREGMHALVSRWRKAVNVDGDYVGK
jgi:hypothetical protein